MATFAKWLETFIGEKGLYMDDDMSVEGPSGLNMMTLETVYESMLSAPKKEQDAIKTMLVKIDFVNGDVRKYFRHLAQALAI